MCRSVDETTRGALPLFVLNTATFTSNYDHSRRGAEGDFGQRHLAVVAVARVGESDDPDRASRLRGSRVTGSSSRAHTLVVGVVVG